MWHCWLACSRSQPVTTTLKTRSNPTSRVPSPRPATPSTKHSEDAAEVLARNIATQQGEEQFNNAGHELDGPLTCEAAVADGVDEIDISCTGTTQDGGAAELTGHTNEIPGASVVTLDGEFTATVDGEEVFTTQRLGG